MYISIDVDDYNDLGPMHSLHVLQQTLLVVNYQHVAQVTPHSVRLLLDGLALGLDPVNQSEVSIKVYCDQSEASITLSACSSWLVKTLSLVSPSLLQMKMTQALHTQHTGCCYQIRRCSGCSINQSDVSIQVT